MSENNKSIHLRPDPVLMRRALKLLGVGLNYVTELRVLDVRDQPNSNFPYIYSGYFNDIEALIKASCSIKYALGWYIMLNPCHPDLLSRCFNRAMKLGKGKGTQDSEITHRAWLPIDTDPVRVSHISSTDAEHHLALDRAREIAEYLRTQGWPDPIVADSGNGGHLLYPINLPAQDGGLIERCLKALDLKFSDNFVKIDTSVSNPARIWKLYGSPACKGDSTSTRPHRMAQILEVPDGY